jgi:hypothetical protein
MKRAFFERGFVIAVSVRFAAPDQAQGPLLSGGNEWLTGKFSAADGLIASKLAPTGIFSAT